MIRWGILAPGRIAHKFAQDLATVPNAKLVAVASRDASRARAFAQEYAAEHAFDSYEALAQCTDVDVVYVASPHVGHHEHTLLCLKNQKAVLCEKPFGMNVSQVADMIQTAQANNVFLMEALWSRFMPWAVKLLELLPSLGRVYLVKADFGFVANFEPEKRLFNKNLGGGAWLDIGIYPAFLSYLVAGMPKHVQAVAQFSSTGVDETIAATLHYAHGTVAMLDATLRAKTACEGIIYAENATVKIHGRWHESQAMTVEYTDGTVVNHNFGRTTWGYNYEIEEVNRCLQNKQLQSDHWSWQDSRNLMGLLDTVRECVGLEY